MPQLIKDGAVTDDSWIIIAADAALPDLQQGQHLLPLSVWLQQREELLGQSNVGVWLASDDSAAAIEPDLKQLPLVAIEFPVFSDGRGYSLARQIRDRYHYKGELRAIGDVLKDQVFFYQRCGFDSLLVRADMPAEQAADGLEDFNVVYQSAADDRVPANLKR